MGIVKCFEVVVFKVHKLRQSPLNECGDIRSPIANRVIFVVFFQIFNFTLLLPTKVKHGVVAWAQIIFLFHYVEVIWLWDRFVWHDCELLHRYHLLRLPICEFTVNYGCFGLTLLSFRS